jgi:ATP-dependent Clp protease ATP-binding subunit ClpA
VFERYSEGSRRVIFYARDAAFEQGSATIEPSHLLLGLEREDKETVERFIAEHPAIEKLRESNSERGTSADLSKIKTSEETVHALRRAASSSDKEGCHGIEVRHLLLGLLKVTEANEELGGNRTNIAHRVWGCIVERVRGVR